MPRKPQKDRTSLVISVVIHIILIGGIVFWAYKTGKLEQMRQAVLQYVKGEKKEEKKPEPVQQKQAAAPKLPPINQGMKAAESSGTRRAVASDAPASSGSGSFVQDTRRQVDGPSSGGSGSKQTNAPVVKQIRPPPPTKPAFAPPPKATIQQLLVERSKAAVSVEAVGSEQIAKAGLSDAGGVVGKVAGASIVDGKFAVIRGLSDRYVTTTFNGGEIPSADPYRRSASLDLFPAQMIDKVVVSKTFLPDLPGSSTAGNINIVSKSFQDRPFASISIGGEYNTQATFNDNYLTYKGGKLDWLGMDDGTRALPAPLNNLNYPIPGRVDTTGPNRPTNPNYSANIQAAEELERLTKLMGTTQFAPERDAPPFNQRLSLAMGDTTHLFGAPFGVFGSWNYKRDYTFYEDGVARRYEPAGTPGEFRIKSDNTDTFAADVVNWGAVVTLAYQWLPDHDVGFNFLFNQNAIDYSRVQVGTQPENNPGYIYFQDRLQFTERSLTTYQLKGEDRFPEVGGIKLEWLAALSQTSQDEPDVRFFNYLFNGGEFVTSQNSLPTPSDPTRYFRNLEEENKNFKVDLTVPFHPYDTLEGALKIGAFSSSTERTFQERQIYYPGGIFDGNPNNYLQDDNLGFINPPFTNAPNGRISYTWQRYIQSFDSFYNAESQLPATYAMLDFPVWDRLRLIGGARVEDTDITVDSHSYTENGNTGKRDNLTLLKQTDVLPAVGVIYAIAENMNLRLNYSQTISRPSFREVAGYRTYDPVLDVLVDGNPDLRIAAIDNYDIRWEWFPHPGELISFSFYRKDIKDAIELTYLDLLEDSATYTNRATAKVTGFEIEARKNFAFLHPLLSDWSLGGNLSLIQSEVELTEEELANKRRYLPNVKSTRPLYDQSPYILNLDLNYDNRRSGTSASLILNVAGPRIVIASRIQEDVYEHPPLMLDFVISQRLNPNMTVRFTAKNLLDPTYERTYGESSSLLYSSYKRGRTFGVSLTYDF